MLWALPPRAIDAQELVVSTSVSRDQQGAAVVNTMGTGAPAFHPSHVLVRFRNGAPTDFLPGSGPARAFPGDPRLFLVDAPPGLSVAEAVRRYHANPNVQYAEPDFMVEAVDILPTDPRWSEQWDMTKISAPAAWQTQNDTPPGAPPDPGDSGNVVVVV